SDFCSQPPSPTDSKSEAMVRGISTLIFAFATTGITHCADIQIPERKPDAVSGSDFVRRIEKLDLAAREQEVLAEFERGNVPEFWRHFVEVKVTDTPHGHTG